MGFQIAEIISLTSYSCEDGLSIPNVKFFLQYGELMHQPLHVCLLNVVVTTRKTASRLHIFRCSCLSRWHLTWASSHKNFNLFQNWTTVREGVVSIEIENYSQLLLGEDMEFSLIKNIFATSAFGAIDEDF